MARPLRILVLATGGTIAGTAGAATRRDYTPGQVGIDQFLATIAGLNLGVDLTGRQITNIGSEDIDWANLSLLHRSVTAAIADPTCDGVIITHGTDTAEETAFLLDQTLPTHKPLILAGAMHPLDAVGSEATRNFVNAVQVASDVAAAGRGVLLVMSDQILAARDARKARTSGAGAFASFPRGPVGMATPSAVEWFSPSWRRGEEARFAWPETLSQVPILHAYQTMDGACVTNLVEAGARGIVLAGFGEGNMPQSVRDALARAAAAGIAVVRSTRVDEGLVDRVVSDDQAGFIAARALGPAKARVLVQLLIAAGVEDVALRQAAFDRR